MALATNVRASALDASGTESSRSRMTASAPLSSALVITRSLIPGANSAVRTGFIEIITSGWTERLPHFMGRAGFQSSLFLVLNLQVRTIHRINLADQS